MEFSAPTRVLVVANRTAATPALIEAVRDRAARGPRRSRCSCRTSHGLHRVVDAEDSAASESEAVLELALPLLEAGRRGEVEGMIGDPEPLAAIQDAVNLRGFDEIILSTLPARVSRWLKLDLPSKVRGLGLPVTHVEAGRPAHLNATRLAAAAHLSPGLCRSRRGIEQPRPAIARKPRVSLADGPARATPSLPPTKSRETASGARRRSWVKPRSLPSAAEGMSDRLSELTPLLVVANEARDVGQPPSHGS